MKVVRFRHWWHTAHIRNWWALRGREGRKDYLPALGFLVPDVAAGFVREVEGGIRILDSFITNPRASPEERNKALDLITQALLDKCMGYKLIAFTSEPSIIRRAQSFNFALSPDLAVLIKRE